MNVFIHMRGPNLGFAERVWNDVKEYLGAPIALHVVVGGINPAFLERDPNISADQIVLIHPEDFPENGPRHISRARCALKIIEEREEPIDTVFAPLAHGGLFGLANARRLGFAKKQYKLVAVHSSTARSLQHEESEFFGLYDELSIEYMEAYVALFADEVRDQESEHPQVPMLRRRVEATKENRNALAHPKVDVVITHYCRSDIIKHTLDAYAEQTYKDFAVTVVDDGSKPEHWEALQELCESYDPVHLKVRAITKENGYLGAARNHGAKMTQGDFLIFNDDDNVPMPHMVEHMVRAMQLSGADIVTSAMATFEYPEGQEERRYLGDWYYLGGALPAALLDNSVGDANAIYRRSVFDDVQFHTNRGVGHEDYEFFTRALLQGKHVDSITSPIFHYRKDPSSMINTTVPFKNLQRHLSAFQELDIRDIQAVLMEAALANKIIAARQTLSKRVKSRMKTVYMRMPKAMRLVVRKGYQSVSS